MNQENNIDQQNYNGVSNEVTQQNINNNNFNQQLIPQTKKKTYWWIPLLLFGIGIFTSVIRAMIDIASLNTNNILYSALTYITIISWLLVVPSIILVLIMKNTDKVPVQNIYDSNLQLDDKLLLSYIGDNYDKITKKVFSIPAFFLSFLYMLYRKKYIPAIIGMVIVNLLTFLPETIYNIIIFVLFVIVGFCFNKWYVNYAKNQIKKIRNNNPNISENELINICRKKGGTNIWIAIVIFVLVSIIFN